PWYCFDSASASSLADAYSVVRSAIRRKLRASTLKLSASTYGAVSTIWLNRGRVPLVGSVAIALRAFINGQLPRLCAIRWTYCAPDVAATSSRNQCSRSIVHSLLFASTG